MSGGFELDDRGWQQKLADARANRVNIADALTPGAFEGAVDNTLLGAVRSFGHVGQAAGILLGGTVGRALDAAFEPDGSTAIQDAIFRKTNELTQPGIDFATPDPHTVGTVGRVLGSLAEMTGPLMAGGGTPLVLAPVETARTAKELIDQGVDARTASAMGSLQGVSSYAGFKLPFLGNTLAQRMLTGAAGNLTLGAGTAEAQKKILESQGYQDLAKGYDPADFTSRAVDLLTGLTFGGLAHVHAPPSVRDAVLAAQDAKHFQQDTAPGVPQDPAADLAHQRGMEAALNALDRGEEVPPAPEVGAANFAPRPARAPPDEATLREVFGEDVPNAEPAELDAAAKHKQYLKQVVDARRMPDMAFLSRDPHAYLEASPTSSEIPLDRVMLSKTGTEGSGDNAIKRFAAASTGEIPKRAPVEVEVDEHGNFNVVDGNGTVTALKKMGLDTVLAEVRPAASLIKEIDSRAPPEIRAAMRDRYTRAARALPKFDREVRAVADEAKGSATVAPIKSVSRAVEKVVGDYGGDPSKLRDVLRGTIAVDDFASVDAAIHGARQRLGEPTRIKNTLDPNIETRDGYRDANLNFTVDGQTVELQVNFPEMIRAKKEMHKLYQERRKFDAKKDLTAEDVASVNALDAQMRAGYAAAWREVLSRLNASSDTSAPSRAKPSETARPSGTSNARIETPPSEVGSAETGTPSTSQNTGALPKTGNDIGVSSGGIVPQEAGARPGILQEKAQATQPFAIRTVSTASGRRLHVKPRLVELSDLITSDKPGYPQELQPRQRGARKALDEQVRTIAQNLDPARLGDSAEADRGAPITGDGNVVESGNGRVMALREVYEHLPEKAAEYRQFLEQQGYDTGDMKQPVLVRERVTDLSMAERRAFTVEANQAATAALSPVERAQADARLIDSAALSRMRGGDVASLQNSEFVRGFLEKLPQAERNALVNPDGSVSQEGVRRIQSALLAKAYGGKPESNATLGRLLESTDSDMRSAMGALLDAAPAFARLRQAIEDGKVAADYDISGALTQAIENVARLRQAGQSLHDFLAQSDAFTQRAPTVDDLMRALYDKTGARVAGREKIAGALIKYAGQASKQRLDQGSLFAEPPIAPDKLVAESAAEEQKPAPKVSDMFGLRTPQGGALEAAKQVLAEQDVPVATGATDAEGNPVMRSGREIIAEAEAGIAKAENDAKGYEAAVSCLLTRGFDNAA